ncbi:MAG: ErpK protein [Lachnospiraceae bacterium]|nr:ErpK protein [Lachnospiraceae bacterium]
MARGKKLTLDEKIEKAQAVVFQTKDRYDAAVEELNQLLKKRKELQQKERLQAIEASPRSYEEIIKFLSETEDSEEE